MNTVISCFHRFPSVHIWIWFCIFLAQIEKQRCILSGGLWSGFLGRPTAAVPFSKSWNSIYNPLKKYSIEKIFLSCFSDSAGVYWFFCDSRVHFFWLWFWCFLVWEAGNLACLECSAIVGSTLIFWWFSVTFLPKVPLFQEGDKIVTFSILLINFLTLFADVYWKKLRLYLLRWIFGPSGRDALGHHFACGYHWGKHISTWWDDRQSQIFAYRCFSSLILTLKASILQ